MNWNYDRKKKKISLSRYQNWYNNHCCVTFSREFLMKMNQVVSYINERFIILNWEKSCSLKEYKDFYHIFSKNIQIDCFFSLKYYQERNLK